MSNYRNWPTNKLLDKAKELKRKRLLPWNCHRKSKYTILWGLISDELERRHAEAEFLAKMQEEANLANQQRLINGTRRSKNEV